MNRAVKTVFNLALSGALLLAFFALFRNVPFLSQPEEARPALVTSLPRPQLSGDTLETGLVPKSNLPGLQVPDTSLLYPDLGLFSAQFAQDDGNPAFDTREATVEGICEGAGRRYIQETCPDCPVLGGDPQPGQPQMLMWVEPGPKGEVVRSITADCTEQRSDGTAVVALMTFGDSMFEPTGDSSKLVPLVPGARRLAAMALGGWLTTMDAINNPATAMADMSTALAKRGWREAEGQQSSVGVLSSEQRVFARNGQETCVVYLSRDNGVVQMITIISI